MNDLCDIDPDVVVGKNRPTFLCKTGNRLYRVSLQSETDTESLKKSSHADIIESHRKRFQISEASTLPELARIVERQNVRMDDLMCNLITISRVHYHHSLSM